MPSTGRFINVTSTKRVQKAVSNAEALKIDPRYDAMKQNLQKLLSAAGMNTVIHFYGSRIMGLANEQSDLDIYVECGNNFYFNKNVEADRANLQLIIEALENGGLWKIQAKILTASVPILQVVYIPSLIQCDISVSNGLGVKNSLLLKYLFDLQPKTKEFYHFMKIFLKRYKYCFEGYLLKLIVVFFFQNEKILPSIKMVQEGLYPALINGWNVQFDPNRQLSYYALNQMDKYKSYIPKFFIFYKDFEYERDVMSLFDGMPVKRDIYPYQEEIEENPLCVFGPINRKHNIGKYPSEGDVKYFRLLSESLASEFTKKYVFN